VWFVEASDVGSADDALTLRGVGYYRRRHHCYLDAVQGAGHPSVPRTV